MNWLIQKPDSSLYSTFTINSLKFYNDRIGFACGGIIDIAGVVWKASNMGNNWLSRGLASEPLYDMVFIDSNKIFCSGGDLEFGASILKTTDAGNTWEYQWLNFFGIGKGISFRTTSEAWIALSYSNNFCVSTNAGQNWYQTPTPEGAELHDVKFVNERNGWAGGSIGAMFKYNSALIGIENNQTQTAGNFIIYPAYPNPFNPSSNISFRIFKNSSVKITVYDILGSERTIITEGILRSGEYKFKLDGTNLPSGVYFCRINIDNNIVTNKLVLMK